MGCSCGTSCSGRCAGFAPGGTLGPLAEALICVEDAGRNVEAMLGLRPYAVRVVRTAWSGAARGQGVETVVEERELLPVPRVGDLSGLSKVINAAQVEDIGTLLISEISGVYTERQLQCLPENGGGLAANESAYFEIQFLGGVRRRFTPASVPMYDADRAQWRVVVSLQRGTRDRATGFPR